MNRRHSYHTRQREQILSFLAGHRERPLTAQAVAAAMAGRAGQTTVYRTLELLTREKQVLKYERPDGKGAYYQYRSGDSGEVDCHLLCSQCGRMMDLDCSLIAELETHIEREHRFHFDRRHTVLRGSCDRCV